MATAPLDPCEERLWRSLMRLVLTLPRALGEDLERTCGLGASEYTVLMNLSEAPARRLRMADLAARAAISPSRITRLIDSMADRGLVERVADVYDGRVSWAVLTKQGFDLLRRAWPHHLESVRRNTFDHLGADEVATLGPVLERLADAVDAANPPPPRRTQKRPPSASRTDGRTSR